MSTGDAESARRIWLGMRELVLDHDRRAKVVTITPAGRAAAEVADGILNRPPKQLEDLPPGDLADLDRLMAALLALSR